MALVPVLFIPLMLFGGFFLNTSDIPVWLIWLKYFSPFKFGFEIACLNEFDGLHFVCSASEKKGGACPLSSTPLPLCLFFKGLSNFPLLSFSSLTLPLPLSFSLSFFHSAGQEVIRNLSMDNAQTNIWSGFLFLLMQYLLFRLIGYVLLRFTAGRKKG